MLMKQFSCQKRLILTVYEIERLPRTTRRQSKIPAGDVQPLAGGLRDAWQLCDSSEEQPSLLLHTKQRSLLQHGSESLLPVQGTGLVTGFLLCLPAMRWAAPTRTL